MRSVGRLSILVRPTSPFLYKYSSTEFLDRLHSILFRNELYFPSPRELQDPDDARPKLVISSREGAVDIVVNAYIAAHPTAAADALARMCRWVNTRTPDELVEEATPLFRSAMERNRVYSMTSRADNSYLWEHYAAAHTGYCLEFVNRQEFTLARLVVYDDPYELDVSERENWDPIFLFRKTWAYKDEEEVRILQIRSGQPAAVSFEPTLLRRVVLGTNMTAEHRETIRGWARTRVPQLLVDDEAAETVGVNSGLRL